MKRLMFIGFLLIIGASLSAQDLTLSQLNQRVLQLEKRIKRLEKILLAQSTKTRIIKIPVGKAAWRKLKRGMSPKDVKKLLGNPDRVTVTDPYTEWTFSSGTIMFYNERLHSWEEKEGNFGRY